MQDRRKLLEIAKEEIEWAVKEFENNRSKYFREERRQWCMGCAFGAAWAMIHVVDFHPIEQEIREYAELAIDWIRRRK